MDAIRFAAAEIADPLVHNSPSRIRCGRLLGRCHAACEEHALSAAAFDAAVALATTGLYLWSELAVVRDRAVLAAGRDEHAGGVGGQQWTEAQGKQRVAEVRGRMEAPV